MGTLFLPEPTGPSAIGVTSLWPGHGIPRRTGRHLPRPRGAQAGPGFWEKVAAGRAADVSFVLDELTGARARWPGAGLIDPGRIAMAGHSATPAFMSATPRHLYVFGTAGEGYAVTEAQFPGGRPCLLGRGAAVRRHPRCWASSCTSLGTVIERIELGYRQFQISFPAWGRSATPR